MEFGIIVGNVVCTTKDEKISGTKLLMVQPVDDNMKPCSTPMIAIDSVGAGEGEFVLFVKGSSARMTQVTENKPVDCTIMAIVDSVTKDGKTIFNKSKSK